MVQELEKFSRPQSDGELSDAHLEGVVGGKGLPVGGYGGGYGGYGGFGGGYGGFGGGYSGYRGFGGRWW